MVQNNQRLHDNFLFDIGFSKHSTGYRSHCAEFEHIDFYWAPVDKNNIPICLALLGSWVSLNIEIVGLSAPDFYTDVMRCGNKRYGCKIMAA